MNQDKIHDALNLLDDDMIEAVDRLRVEKKKKKKRWVPYISVAACVLVLFVGLASAGALGLLGGQAKSDKVISDEFLEGEPEYVKKPISENNDNEEDDTMNKRILMAVVAATLIVTMIVPLAGCATKVKAKDLTDGIKAEKVDKTDGMSTGNEALTDFAINLFNASNEGKGNTLISPLSVIYALAMTANGAEGDTLKQMEEVFGMSMDELNPYLYTYKNNLPQGDKYKLHMANSIWYRENVFTPNKNFLQENVNYYGAELYESPFNDETVKDINNWVKNNTDKMIDKIVDEVDGDMVMYLINALAFDAKWDTKYEKKDIKDGKFTLENGSETDVEFMYSTEKEYIEDEDAKGFIKYYKDKKYAFVALLPDEDVYVSEYLASLNGEKITSLLKNKKTCTVKAAIPKFEAEYEIVMNDALRELGIKDAFTTDADFSAMGSADGILYIDTVIHKTYISVDENGTKAAAVTSVGVKGASAIKPDEVKEVYLDRPFAYMIIDCENNVPIFIGTTMEVK